MTSTRGRYRLVVRGSDLLRAVELGIESIDLWGPFPVRDGDVAAEEANLAFLRARTEWLRSEGFEVELFSVAEVETQVSLDES